MALARKRPYGDRREALKRVETVGAFVGSLLERVGSVGAVKTFKSFEDQSLCSRPLQFLHVSEGSLQRSLQSLHVLQQSLEVVSTGKTAAQR